MSCVFLTGATGVIGSELVAQLLQQPECEIYALMRADSSSHLEVRRGELLEFCGADVAASERLHAVAGDISKTHLGLDEDLIRHLINRVTHIIHCAGNVRLNQDLAAARRNAVEPARLILDFARRCPQLEKIDVVSTIGVCGTMRGLIPERRLSEPRKFRNHYEAAKAEAEDLYYDAMEEGLPLTVHRPSMVVGHSQTGHTRQFQVFYHLCEFLSGRRSFGLVVDPGQTTLDLVPVDWVAATILRSSASSEAAGQTLHLCAGPEKAVSILELTQRVRDRFGHEGVDLPRLRVVSPRWFRLALWAGRAGGRKIRRRSAALRHFFAYLNAEQAFAASRVAELGWPVAPHPDEFLPTVWDAYLNRP